MGKQESVSEVSSGGFVISSEDPKLIALMARFNRAGKLEWCIPKGHTETGETVEQAAVREVFEETGLEAKIIEKIGEVKYQFSQASKNISKTVHVYLMQQTGGMLTMENDPHHEASELAWVSIDELQNKLSHSNERKVAEKIIEIVKGMK